MRRRKERFHVSALAHLVCWCSDWHRKLLPTVQSPQRVFRIDSLTDAVYSKGVVPTVTSERAVAMRAEAVAVVLPVAGVYAQAGMFVKVKRTEIQPTPPRRSCAVAP